MSLEPGYEEKAKIFRVLGDSTRLKLVANLVNGKPCSITELSAGFELSRQAVTKHLRLLEDAGLVNGEKSGRENLYELNIESLVEARATIESIQYQWDQSLARLKALVEE